MTNSHTFKLANGNEIAIDLCESGLGVSGFRIRVIALSGNLVVRPSSGNSLTISTEEAVAAEKAALVAVKQSRDATRR